MRRSTQGYAAFLTRAYRSYPASMMRRYLFEVVEWYVDDRRRRYWAITEGGEHKAAWLVGSAFESEHPRTPIKDLVLVSVEASQTAQPDDLRDANEWR